MSSAGRAGEAQGGATQSRRGRLGPILAGGAGTALIAGALIALLSTAAFVGIGLLPGGGDDGDVAVDVGAAPAGAPEAAAIAAAPTPDAVAAAPAAPTAVAPPLLLAAAGGTGSVAGGAPDRPGGGGSGSGTPVPGPGPGPAPPGPPPPGGPGPTTQAGALQGAVRDLDHTVSTLGLGVRLDPPTSVLTRPLDQTLNGTLNGVGSLVGTSRLGNHVDRAANGVTGGLLGPGGLTDALLRPRR